MGHCHCSICRKFTGAAYNTDFGVPPAGFRFVAGEDLLSVYRYANRKDMVFCSVGGSSLLTCESLVDGPMMWVRAGTLDADPGIRPLMHIWVGSNAPWYELTDALPQVVERPD